MAAFCAATTAGSFAVPPIPTIILVPASGQAVGVIERRVADRTAAGDHVVHLDEHAEVLGVDAGGEVDVGLDVILERVNYFEQHSGPLRPSDSEFGCLTHQPSRSILV
jgi:hypothetical protein